jgi:hypothetical protein
VVRLDSLRKTTPSVKPVNTPAALVVRVAGSVRVALELDGGVAIVTRSAPG